MRYQLAGGMLLLLLLPLYTSLLLQALDRQLAGEQGSKLDVYELEVANERADVLQDLSEFQLAVVSFAGGTGMVQHLWQMWQWLDDLIATQHKVLLSWML